MYQHSSFILLHRGVVWVILDQFRTTVFYFVVADVVVAAVGMWATRLRCPHVHSEVGDVADSIRALVRSLALRQGRQRTLV